MSEEERIDKVIIYVLGRLDGLVAKGLVCRSDNSTLLSDKGRKMLAVLDAEGFIPTAEEIGYAVNALKDPAIF